MNACVECYFIGVFRRILTAFGLLLVVTTVCNAHFFTQPGGFLYAQYKLNHKVIVTTADGKMAVVLKNDEYPNLHRALITTFDLTSGVVLDNESMGFGPLGVELAETENGIRVVVLTSEGGPRKIYLFSLDSAGNLTLINSTQLTTSGTDLGSNIVVSAGSQTGFAIVASADFQVKELVTFSLVNASILNRYSASNPQWQIYADLVVSLMERNDKRILTFMNDVSAAPRLQLIDVFNPLEPVDLGGIPLPNSGSFLGSGNGAAAFSLDGRYAFTGSPYMELVAVDLQTMQAISHIDGTYGCSNVRILENVQERLLAAQCFGNPGANDLSGGIRLINATNPAQISVINTFNLSNADVISRGDVVFSKTGKHMLVQTGQRLLAVTVPALTTAWTEPVPGATESFPVASHDLVLYGEHERVLGAWGNTATLFGLFEVDRRRRGQTVSD